MDGQDVITPSADKYKPFTVMWPDRAFAAVFYLMGWLYVSRILFGGYERRMFLIFALLYSAAMLCYFYLKGLHPPRFSWFWLGCLLALGLSFALYKNISLMGFDTIVLHGLALYWPLCAAGASLRGCTSGLLPYDVLNCAFIVPWANFFALLRSAFGGWKLGGSLRGKAPAVLVGILLLAVILAMVLPLLGRANESFGALVEVLLTAPEIDPETVAHLLLALPVACVLFGLAYGLANRRHTEHICPQRLTELGGKARVVPNATAYIAMGGVCLVYAVFIAFQAEELFSAFFGRLSGTDIYSQFAREGFFELCRVAAINGGVLLFAGLLSTDGASDSRAMRAFNTALAALTLLILASAASKMLLYVSAYGLTPKRVLTLAFMLMLAVLFAGIIVYQRKKFNLIRLSLCFAAVLFCALALCGLDKLISAFNSSHGFGAVLFQ